MPKVTEAHKDKMRLKIRESAKPLFLQKGFRSVSMKDIVVASGLSFGAVYSYYSNTSEIFLALKQDDISAEQRDYQAMLNFSTKQELIDYYSDFLTNRLSHIQETLIPATYDYLAYVEKGIHHQMISEIVYRQLEQQIGEILQHGAQHSLISAREIPQITSFLLVYVEGLYFQQAFLDTPPTKQSLASFRFILNKLFL